MEVSVEQIASVIGRAASDPAFRQQLLTSPGPTLQSAGVAVPAGMSVKVVEDTAAIRYAVVPARPDGVSDAELAEAAKLPAPAPDSVPEKIVSFSQLVAASWLDSTLRSELLADPTSTLTAHGIALPAGVQARSIESNAQTLVLVIPPLAAVKTSGAQSGSAQPGSDTAPKKGIGRVATKVVSNFGAIANLITAGSYVAGLGFGIAAILKFKGHKDNPTQIPIGTPIALIYVAAALLFLPVIE